MIVWGAVVVVLAAAVGVLASFNRFVQQRNLLRNAWSNVDTELRRRYDLVPNLVDTVRAYAAHERATFEAVVKARLAAISPHLDAVDQSRSETTLTSALGRLLAVAEGYPDLKANGGFLDLQRQLVTTEDRIQAARRLFNANVRDYNRRVESFPSLVVARTFGFRREAYFELEPAVRHEPPPSVAAT